MSKISRLKIIRSMLKNAGYLTDLVDKRIEELQSGKSVGEPADATSATGEIEYTKPLTAYVPGAQVMVPKNPFDATGGYNVMFVFRYRHDTNWSAGVNTIIVMADKGQQYTAEWVANALKRIQSSLVKVNPNAHLNKYGISAHSGGYTVAGRLLSQREKMEEMVGKPLDAVVLADAGHEKLVPAAMQPYVEFARKAAEGKGDFIHMHTAIPGWSQKYGKFTSTTEHANYILEQLGMERQQGTRGEFSDWRVKPVSVSEQGGLRVVQLDDKERRRYDPQHRDAPGTSGYMHNESARHLPDAWRMLSGWN